MPEFDSTTRYAPVANQPGYCVGTDGSIWSRWKVGSKKPGGELLSSWHRVRGTLNDSGYIMVCFRTKRLHRLHRIILETFVGPCPPGMEACHDPDRDRKNCALSNLRWDTRKSNHADQAKHGTKPIGERKPSAKLTEADVVQIREQVSSGASRKEVAASFGIHRAHLNSICRHRFWSHV